MKLSVAEFVTSASGAADLPKGGLPEIAFVGRSNVGKSSLINALVGRQLARTSATPGKTRLVNIYRVERAGGPAFHLVDLPGYGYTRRRGPDRPFETLLNSYFLGERANHRRPAIAGVVLLVDARHPGMAADTDAALWLAHHDINVMVVATKVDKLSQKERTHAERAFEATFLTRALPVSVRTGEGLEELWKRMVAWLNQQ